MDGLSFVPELLGEEAAGRKQAEHELLYWEFCGAQAVRQDNWRAVRPFKSKTWELHDVGTDPGESKDLAANRPDILAKLVALAEKAHQPVRTGTQ